MGERELEAEGAVEMSTRRLATVVILVACAAAPVRAQDQERATAPAVLAMWNRPIVTFRAVVGGAAPEERVRNARTRIEAHTRDVSTASVGTRDSAIGDIRGVLVTIGDNVAFGLVPGDLDPEAALTLEAAASQAAQRLRGVLAAREQQRRLPVLARGIGLTILALASYAIVCRLVMLGREVAIRKLDAVFSRRQLVIGGIDVVPTLATVKSASFRLLSWAVIGVVSYLALTFVLQLFPLTAPLGARLGGFLTGKLSVGITAVFLSLPRLIGIAAVLLVARSVSLWVSRVLAEVEHGARTIAWLAQEQARATRRIATGLVWILAIAIAYSLLPWSSNPIFRGMSLVIGLGASLASAGLVNQWISGLVVLYSRSFRIGDFVKIGDVEGFVAEIGSLATKIRTIRREEITIPNAVVTTEKLTNFTRMGEAQGSLLSVSIAIGYDVPWQRVQALLLEAAATTQGVRSSPSPRVFQWELTDFYVQHQLHVYLERAEDRAYVRSALNARILDAFAAAGVQIMTPHFESQPEKPVIAAAVPLAR